MPLAQNYYAFQHTAIQKKKKSNSHSNKVQAEKRTHQNPTNPVVVLKCISKVLFQQQRKMRIQRLTNFLLKHQKHHFFNFKGKTRL